MAQIYDDNTWEKLFENDKDGSGMSPYWTQISYFQICQNNGKEPLKFERIVPYFPMTKAYDLYDELREIKNQYRGNFGVPNESGAVLTQNRCCPLKINKIQL